MATMNFLTRTEFDFGAIKRMPEFLKSLGIARPFIATDKGLVAVGIVDKVREAIGAEFEVTVFDDTPENPTEAAVTAATDLYKQAGCDGVIALGGGSSMDLGKAVSLMALSQEPLTHYAGVAHGKVKAVAPVIAVPTTAGTGSEVSVGFVVIVEDGRKLTFVANEFIPRIALCDPELTLGLPKGLTAATGMDAMTHCIEAVCSPVQNPVAEAIGLDGIERGIGKGWLEKAVTEGGDKQARWNMMLASTEGAMSFVKGLGAVHAMSHSAGRLKGMTLHHGTLNAVLLPPVLRYNADHAKEKYERIKKAANLAPSTDLADYVEELNARLGLPKNLGEMGVTADKLPELVENAVTDLANFSNPRKMKPDDYAHLFEQSIGAGKAASA